MKGDIIKVDYTETNNLDKGLFIKKIDGFITLGLSASRRNY